MHDRLMYSFKAVNSNVTCGQGAKFCELILNLTVYCLLNLFSLDRHKNSHTVRASVFKAVSQPPGHGLVPGPGMNYTEPREVLLEFVILVF